MRMQKVESIVKNNVLKKLKEEGLNIKDFDDSKVNELINLELDIIKRDGKKVGSEIAIGLFISFETRELF